MSLLLSAQTGEAVTPAQLLGEEAQDKASKVAEGEKAVAAAMKRAQKAGVL